MISNDEVVRIQQEHQYDNGNAAGSPPSFVPPDDLVPDRESVPTRRTSGTPGGRYTPFGGTLPVLTDAPGSNGSGLSPNAPRAPEDSVNVQPVALPSAQPVLRSDGQPAAKAGPSSDVVPGVSGPCLKCAIIGGLVVLAIVAVVTGDWGAT